MEGDQARGQKIVGLHLFTKARALASFRNLFLNSFDALLLDEIRKSCGTRSWCAGGGRGTLSYHALDDRREGGVRPNAMEAVRFGRVVPALLACTLHLRAAPRAFALRHQQGDPCVLRSADRNRGTVSYVSTEPQRTCPSCGNEFSGAMEFCPVVVLLEKLLEKDPAQRFQTPDELLKAMPTITGAIEARRGITRRNLQQIHPPTPREGTRKPPTRSGPKKISIARLPITGSDVFGREEDIGFLDDAWANQHG